MPAWDGSPRLELVRYANANGVPASLDELKQYLDVGSRRARRPREKIYGINPPQQLSVALTTRTSAATPTRFTLAAEGGEWLVHRPPPGGVLHLPARQVRTFRIDHKGRLGNISYYLTIDDHPGRDQFEFSQSLSKGAHRIDVYFAAQRNAQPVFDVVCDVPQPPYIAPCPPELFDIKKHPEITAGVGFEPADILADTELKTRQDNTNNLLAAAKVVQVNAAKALTDARGGTRSRPHRPPRTRPRRRRRPNRLIASTSRRSRRPPRSPT